MTETTSRAWWLAVAALALCGPWPGWSPQPLALAAVVALMVVLARPRGRERWPWLGVVVALAGALAPVAPPASAERLSRGFAEHAREMLTVASGLTDDERLLRLFAATGEALDPARPFAILDEAARGSEGRTVYLADDRGRLLAWGGAERSYPFELRPLGPRTWALAWSASGGVLVVREPIMIEGRIVGSVTVADRAALRSEGAWGMDAPRGRRLVLGRTAPGATAVATDVAPGITVPAGSEPVAAAERRAPFAAGWLLVMVATLVAAPGMAWVALVVGLAGAVAVPGQLTTAEQMVLVLLVGATAGRTARRLPAPWARTMLAALFVAAAAVRLFGDVGGGWSWLPAHLLRPGWGGVWMVALAWAASGWPTLARRPPSLELKMAVAVGLAVAGLVLDAAWYPVRIADLDGRGQPGVALPRTEVEIAELLPGAPAHSRLDDLAPVLAERWGLDRWRTPSRLTLVGPGGFAVSSWGDLGPAGDRQRLARQWPLDLGGGARLELDVATEPWSWLADWDSGATLEAAWRQPVWYAVLTRSGAVAATLHPEIRPLDLAAAGEAYHEGSAWLLVGVGDGRALARVVRRGDWLVAAVAHPPAAPVWVVRAALAVLWALLGLALARPPALRLNQLATFGGRLRLLVAGGVVIPLVILTLFLQLRLGREEARIEEVLGRDSLGAARYTIEHLGGGVEVNDELASWLAGGWGGEVVFFDHADPIAVSRPDLLSVGRLPQLPLEDVFTAYLLGRDDAVVARPSGWLAAAGAVEVEGRRLLLHLYRSDPLRTGDGPEAVDWLLTGALLAAVLTLIATGRIEERLSASLRDLVGLAGRLVRGEPLGTVRRPRETDLAEVLDAVRSMNEEVHRRELSLRHQEELLRITLANLAPAVMVLDPSGELEFANPSAEALLEAHGELVGERVRELAGEIQGELGATTTEQPIPGRDLTWRIGVAAVPLPDGGRGLVAVVDDVTEVVRVDRLQQLTQLARIVAHEVKNPLTPIRLWVQELDEARRRHSPDLEALLAEACREIAAQVERLRATATSFSNLVALEHWQPERVDMARLAEATLDGLGVLERRGIAVVRHIADPGEAVVTGDRQWLRRAVANLVQNSLDALGEGPGEIRLEVTADGELVVLEVEDSGGGVPAEQLPDLFSPHFSTTASGSGLGLALVAQVVARCQGRVEAVNGARGLRVRLELPSVTMTP
ncbi:MAG TPA: ATP-binding protein [Methylomirabilota bacterium]|nr:ATP-binding protein [Methylomirabilota bacterium]